MALAWATAKANAQEKTLTYPQFFVGIQGGGQTTLTDYNNWKLVTPTASFSVGSFFTPVVGARLYLNGIWNKGGYWDDAEDFKYIYKYLTSDVDMLINLSTLIGRKNYYPMNVFLIGGIGLNYAWDNGEAFARNDKLTIAYGNRCFSHNARVGLGLEWNVSKHVGINLEVDANNLKDRYNSKMSEKGDWQLTAQLGVAYKFAAKKGAKSKEQGARNKEQVPPEVWETRQDTIWYDDVVEAPRPAESTRTWTVFYGSGQTDFKDESQLQAVVEFQKEWSDCKIEVKSYADLGTGNIAADPCLLDPENGDYRLSLISPCRDTGSAVANAIAFDLAGVARPQGAAIDRGCYEFTSSGASECAIKADADQISIGADAVISAIASPEEGISSYLWTIRDAAGEHTETTATPGLRYTGAAAGNAEITCTVLWTGGGEATSRPVSVAVLPSVVHASLAGAHVWPFDTEAKAATTRISVR